VTEIEDTPEIFAFSRYGDESAGERVRVFDWLSHSNVRGRVEVFAQYDAENKLSGLLRRSPKLVRRHARLLKCKIPNTARVLIYRDASPFGHGFLEERLLRNSAFGLFDFDDAIHLQLSAGRLGRLFPPPEKMIRVISAADRVIAGNQYLVDFASQYCADVVRIPSCVDTDRYSVKAGSEFRGVPCIGWVGSYSTDRYLDVVAKPLLALHQKTGVRLLLLGATTPHRGALEAMIDRVQWTESNQYDQIKTMDIGIMPLLNTEYELGKCAYKLLQYAAAGVPSIGSPIGANEEVLNGVKGWAPRTEAEWYDSMLDAITLAPEKRSELGTFARAFVEREYSYRAWSKVWETEVLGR
jgi:glycosyltransferase involved in cell wall biosynthesis